MAKHATLSASGTARWLNCPGSIQASVNIPAKPSSIAAKLSRTAAHYLAEYCLKTRTDPNDFLNEEGRIFIKDDDAVGLRFKATREGEVIYKFHEEYLNHRQEEVEKLEYFCIDADMIDAVSTYWNVIERLRQDLPQLRHTYIEKYLDLRGYDTDLGGTCDWAGMSEHSSEGIIVDYKNGSGVVVDVNENEQLKTYALGFLILFPNLETIKTMIVQPRAYHSDGPVRSSTYTAYELRDFGKFLAAGAKDTRVDTPMLRAGDWCRYCSALSGCPEARKEVTKQAGIEFSDTPCELPEITDGEKIGQILKWAPYFKSWIAEAQEYAMRELSAGRKIEGYKLVKRRSNRVWINDPVSALKEVGLKEEDIFTKPTLHGPAAIEKLGMDKEQRSEVKKLVKTLVENPDKGVTIAVESDSREAITIDQEFGDLPRLN